MVRVMIPNSIQYNGIFSDNPLRSNSRREGGNSGAQSCVPSRIRSLNRGRTTTIVLGITTVAAELRAGRVEDVAVGADRAVPRVVGTPDRPPVSGAVGGHPGADVVTIRKQRVGANPLRNNEKTIARLQEFHCFFLLPRDIVMLLWEGEMPGR